MNYAKIFHLTCNLPTKWRASVRFLSFIVVFLFQNSVSEHKTFYNYALAVTNYA